MSLAALIRGKSASDTFATATPATFATPERGSGRTVAKVATVTVAKPSQLQTAPSAKASPGDAATVSRWWRVHYRDRDPVEVSCSPPANIGEVMKGRDGAEWAEAITPAIRQPSAPLTAEEKSLILGWMELIEETDPEVNAEVIGQCQRDADTRAYFIEQAVAQLPRPGPLPDDRRPGYGRWAGWGR